MDNLRIFLLISLALVGAMIYGQWQDDYSQTLEQAQSAPVSTSSPTESPVDLPNRPTVEASAQSDVPASAAAGQTGASQKVHIKTDVLDITLDTRGGNVVNSQLLKYTTELGEKTLITLQTEQSQRYFSIQSGLLGNAGATAPDHHAAYSVAQTEYQMGAKDQLSVPLVWEQDGLKITKRYTFYKGSYLFDLSFDIENKSGQNWSGHQYRQLQRTEFDNSSSPFLVTYTGGVIYDQEERYQKLSYDDLEEEPLNQSFDHGWAAMIQHYFLTALVPPKEASNHYYSRGVSKGEGKRYILGMTSPEIAVAAGQSESRTTQVFVGPKLQDRLEEVAEGLDLTVDYGFLTIISKPLFHLLSWLHSYIGNWGWSIIMLTAIIKLLFFPLSQASYRSMAKMRQVTPKLQQIRERYSDDRQRLSQEMMNLYKKEKINPVGSCLPMIIQIPVFIALYWALLESVELRQAPFILWISDLSTKDPFYVLPLIMGLTMYFQQKLNPTPPDPMQAKVFMMMPVVFTAFFAFFPAGLVLYWVTNNTLSIVQQWWITRQLEAANSKK